MTQSSVIIDGGPTYGANQARTDHNTGRIAELGAITVAESILLEP